MNEASDDPDRSRNSGPADTVIDRLESHVSDAAETATDEETRFHLRQALQLVDAVRDP